MIEYRERIELSKEAVTKFLNDSKAESKADKITALSDLYGTCHQGISEVVKGDLKLGDLDD